MAETYKVLAQVSSTAATEIDLYTLPTDKYVVVSGLTVANRSSDDATIRISIAVGGVSTSDEQYVVYDEIMYGNSGSVYCKGITLGADDVVRVYASSDYISFGLFGVEVDA